MTIFRQGTNRTANYSVQHRVLSNDQIQMIFNSALEVLERSGSIIKHPEALELLKKAGCRVDGELVKIPPAVIQKAVASAPKRIVYADRYGKRKLFLEGRNSYFGNGPTNPFYSDYTTGLRRPVLKADVYNNAKVTNAMPNIDFVMSLAGINDCHPDIADVHEVHAMLQSTTKPIACWGTGVDSIADTIDMASVVAGGLKQLQENPFLICYVGDPVSPLVHPEDALGKLLYVVGKGLPVVYPSGMQNGGVSPVTIAGSLVLGLAEQLTGLLISQLKREGNGYICSIIDLTFDMTTTNSAYGSPELCLSHNAADDIFHFFGLPTWSTAGASDSKVVDQQAAIEATFQIYSAILSGGSLVHDVGFMESAMSASLQQVVMCNEIIGMARRLASGIEVNEKTMAVDVICAVGPGGQYLTEDHTFKYFKDEVYFPTLIDRTRYVDWAAAGSKTMLDRINDKIDNILAQQQPDPLPADIVRELDKIMARAENRVGKKK